MTVHLGKDREHDREHDHEHEHDNHNHNDHIDDALLDALVNLNEYLHALALSQCAARSASGVTRC